MNDLINKILWAAGTIVVALVLVAVLFPREAKQVAGALASGAGVTNLIGELSIGAGNGIATSTLETQQVSFYHSAGDVNQAGVVNAMIATSGVSCALQNPFLNATSTFEFLGRISSTSVNASNMVITTAANQYATTTLWGTIAVAAGAQASITTQGTSTTALGGVVGPGQFVNLGGIAGSGAALSQYGGTCEGIFTQFI